MDHYAHDGSTQVQSPAIGYALRQALSLDAAGSMGMDAGLTVHPVAIVADVRAQLNAGDRLYSGWRFSTPVAAQFATCGLSLLSAPPSSFLYARPISAVISVDVATYVYWRFGVNVINPGTDAVPRQLNTLVSTAGAISAHGGAVAGAVTPGQQNGIFYVPANTPQRITFPDMRIYPGSPFVQAPGLAFQSSLANLTMVAEFIWEEVYR